MNLAAARFKAASLGQRVVSATVALTLLVGVAWRFGAFGLQLLVGLAMVLMIREFLRLSLRPLGALPIMIAWFLLSAVMTAAAVLASEDPLAMEAVVVSGFLTVSLWLTRNKMANERLLPALALGLLGLFVCVIFPSYSIRTLRLPHGLEWFALHLVIVFSGDVFAYFGGIGLGRAKLMPDISPQKTVVGALTGLAGSVVLGGLTAHFLLPRVALWMVLVFAVVCGFVAQMGDLLMSLVKRVADVKDSGTLMPGHGGILDRADGVIMTCPLIYVFAYAAETWL